MFIDLIWVALGGFFGALARYGLGRALLACGTVFPWGTFFVNITGSLLLGFIQALAIEFFISPRFRLFAGVGFCGAYTTFSAFTKESLDLLACNLLREVLLYVVGTGVLCFCGAWLGMVLGRLLLATLDKGALTRR